MLAPAINSVRIGQIIMQDNRNATFASNAQGGCCTHGFGNGTVCIDTHRVLDCCRDRDCFENVRIYLTPCGEEILASSTNLRTRGAKLLCANVSVNEIPFNNGFYQVVVRYYIEVEFEACVGVGRSQTFKGLAALEKDVILYGGEGRAMSFSSGLSDNFCGGCDVCNMASNDPVAVVDTVEPIVLGTKVVDCSCPCACPCSDIPDRVLNVFGGELIANGSGARIAVSFGVFSVIRIVRPAQLLVQATDYSVPDKECSPATSNDNPCDLFRTVAFPVSQFRGTDNFQDVGRGQGNGKGGSCGCSKQ